MAKASWIAGDLKGNRKRLAGAVSRELAKVVPEKYSPALLRQVSNAELAAELAGTGDKRTKEYKAALRNVQRYKKEGGQKRSARPEMKAKIERAVRGIFKSDPDRKIGQIGAGRITVSGTVTYSNDTRRRTLTIQMDKEQMQEFARTRDMEFAFAVYMAEVPHYRAKGESSMQLESGTVGIYFA